MKNPYDTSEAKYSVLELQDRILQAKEERDNLFYRIRVAQEQYPLTEEERAELQDILNKQDEYIAMMVENFNNYHRKYRHLVWHMNFAKIFWISVICAVCYFLFF